MKILRIKGYNIPILIKIEIIYPNITYKFNTEDEDEKDFDYIKNYLFNVKNDYENQLDTIYQNEKYLRFLYGKLFRKIKLHQEGNYEVKEIIRYILNKVDYKDKDRIEDGEPYNVKIGDDFEIEFRDYTKKIFENMSKYIISLFEINKLDFEEHYKKMLIKREKNTEEYFYINVKLNLWKKKYYIYSRKN